MKKWLLIGGIAFMAVLGVAIISGAFFAGQWVAKAQAPNPETPFGFGQRGGGWMMDSDSEIHDAMHTAMHSALADQLGLTVEELDAQIAEGKTVWLIAEEKGMTEEEITALMTDARQAALDQLVADGTLTQEQAAAMAQRGAGMGMRGGRGGCTMMNGTSETFGFGRMHGSGMRGNR